MVQFRWASKDKRRSGHGANYLPITREERERAMSHSSQMGSSIGGSGGGPGGGPPTYSSYASSSSSVASSSRSPRSSSELTLAGEYDEAGAVRAAALHDAYIPSTTTSSRVPSVASSVSSISSSSNSRTRRHPRGASENNYNGASSMSHSNSYASLLPSSKDPPSMSYAQLPPSVKDLITLATSYNPSNIHAHGKRILSHSSSSSSSCPSHPLSPTSSKRPGWWPATKRITTLLLQSAIFALAIYGGYMLVIMKFGGIYMRIPVYSQYEIQEAGWDRPVLISPNSHAHAQSGRVKPLHGVKTGTVQPVYQIQQDRQSPPYVLNDDDEEEDEEERQAKAADIYDDPSSSDSTPTTRINTRPASQGTTIPAVSRPQTKNTTLYTLSESVNQSSGSTSLQVFDFDRHHLNNGVKRVQDLHILILTPLKNAQEVLHHFFALVENLDHPKENLSIGLLVGDEEDETGSMVNDWCVDQEKKGDYRKITLLKRDFGLPHPSGEDRHKHWLQAQRRELLAKARTLLLTATLEPTVDWVLWLDSDLSEVPRTLISDLLYYGNAGVHPANDNILLNEEDREPYADVITPNIMRRKGAGRLQGYDLNNWSETPKSLKMKAKLPKDRVLWEGNRARPTYRTLLARSWIKPNISSSWDDSNPRYPYCAAIEGPSSLHDPDSEAYIGRLMELDGVGGVATLVRGWVHRFGAVFPSWTEDHQVETEGFGIMAKQLGARMVGLPNYLVFHHSKDWPSRLPGTVKLEDGTPW